MKTVKIHDFPLSSRPRERFMNKGSEALSDAELLALVLRIGTQKYNVLEMSNLILAKYDLNKLSKLSIDELKEIPGVGKVLAIQIRAMFALTLRTVQEEKTIIKSPDDAYRIFRYLSSLEQEHFIVLCLDSRNAIISSETVSIGILDAALVHPREIFRAAIRSSAAKIILIHNHPSGNTTPSDADREIFGRLEKAAEIIGIPIVDHIIIGEGFSSNGISTDC